jgi:uncharacterized protein (DUF885 family)
MKERLWQFQKDEASLSRTYRIEASSLRRERFTKFYVDSIAQLSAVDFEKLDESSRVDYILYQNHLGRLQIQLAQRAKWFDGAKRVATFADLIIGLDEERTLGRPVDAYASAATLAKLTTEIQAIQAKITEGSLSITPEVGFPAWQLTKELVDVLSTWFHYYDGYDPAFCWWVRKPYEAASEALTALVASLEAEALVVKNESGTEIAGYAVGREVLEADLAYEMIPYSPEELIEVGEREYRWCEAEMRKASQELGFGDDWRQALEHVKTLHVAPGKQPELVRELAEEAIAFVEANDLVTVPAIAKETWRMKMMSPKDQLVNPFFLGGEAIIVSYPTDEMTHERKMMSMRGNNRHFSRATVQHELIPGHHLQMYMLDRYRSYRSIFGTPFWIEGWALHWEMLLWDLNFPVKPEDRIGMLFWRMHRCVRISFSLKFHLGLMTAQECVETLVERVGHERANAEGEVRRSFSGAYPPLYQVAYMIGGLQFRAMHQELVGRGVMTNQQFHDVILRENEMPVTILREVLKGNSIPANGPEPWRFLG